MLLDAVLPDGSGFEVCSRLREGEPGRAWDRDVPVIMVTARSAERDIVRGLEAGANDYMPKPLDIDKLLSLCRVWMPRAA